MGNLTENGRYKRTKLCTFEGCTTLIEPRHNLCKVHRGHVYGKLHCWTPEQARAARAIPPKPKGVEEKGG